MGYNSALDFYKITNNPNNAIKILLPQHQSAKGNTIPATTIDGYLEEDFLTGGGNNWGTAFQDNPDTENVNQKVAQQNMGFLLKNLEDSRAIYGSSNPARFNLKFYVIALDSNENVVDKLKNLYYTVYPTTSGFDGGSILLRPPLHYNGQDTGVLQFFGIGKLQGTIKVSIGNWMYLDQLIVDNLSIIYSNVVTKKGHPLYAKVDIALRTYRVPTADEYVSLFQKPTIVAKPSQTKSQDDYDKGKREEARKNSIPSGGTYKGNNPYVDKDRTRIGDA